MTLGLDLQGGSHILLQIDRQDLANERLETTRDDIRTLLRDAKIGYTGLTGSGNAVQVRIRDAGAARGREDGARLAPAAGRLQHVRGRHDHRNSRSTSRSRACCATR